MNETEIPQVKPLSQRRETTIEKFRNLLKRVRPHHEMVDPTQEQKPTDISRREFLKRAVVVGAGTVVLSQIPSSEPAPTSIPQKLETENKTHRAQTVIVDLAPEQPTQGINQQEFVDTSKIWDVVKLRGFPTVQEMLQDVPSKKPVSNNADVTTYFIEQFGELEQRYGEKFYPAMLFTIMMNEKKDHGVKVAHALEQSNAFYGKQEIPTLYPSQEAYQHVGFRSFTEGNEYWTNHGLELTITADMVIPLLQKAKTHIPTPHAVFNLSWQVGSQEVVIGAYDVGSARAVTIWSNTEHKGRNGESSFFVFPDQEYGPLDGKEQTIDGKTYFVFDDVNEQIITKNGTSKYYVQVEGKFSLPAMTQPEAEQLFDQLEGESEQQVIEDPMVNPVVGIEIREAYRRGKVQQNIQEVIKIANIFPDDFLVLAAGNSLDDLRDAPQLPKNVVLVGEWHEGSIKPTGQVYGADIYVPNSELTLGRGSSFSVPFIAATIEQMLAHGVPFHDVKHMLKTLLSSEKPYRARITGDSNSTSEQANVFDLQKVQQKIMSARTT